MSGRNLYYSRSLETEEKRTAVTKSHKNSPCVFISHKNCDSIFAAAVGEVLNHQELNTWLDLDNDTVQALWEAGEAHELAKEIEHGIQSSTHLLALVTPNTMGSWWVPFEIGQARARGVSLAFLFGSENPREIPDKPTITFHITEKVPEYFCFGDEINDIRNLRRWISEISGCERWLSKDDVNLLLPFVPEHIRPFLIVK